MLVVCHISNNGMHFFHTHYGRQFAFMGCKKHRWYFIRFVEQMFEKEGETLTCHFAFDPATD